MTSDLLDDLVPPEARDELGGRGHREVPLEVDPPAVPALLDQVETRHAGSGEPQRTHTFRTTENTHL